MQYSTLAKRAWLLFFLAAAAFYFYGLGRLPLVGPDEPRYAQVAREMLERHDPVTPTLGGHTWFEKPALLYWMMMAGYSAFGVSEWAARLGPALSGLLSALLLYWMSRRVMREGASEPVPGAVSLWSGVALATSLGLIAFSRGASFDIVVTMTVTAALACFFASDVEAEGKRRRWLLAGFYAAVGASLLAKGLVGIVMPGGIIALYYALRRRWPERQLVLSAAWGVPLALLVAAAWYAPVIARHGWTFVEEFFVQHHFARFISNKFHHPQPFYFYLPIMGLLALPWTAFLVAGLVRARRWNWREPTAASKLRIFALAWLVFPVLFFSLSGSKLPGYVLPALPGAALLVGDGLSRFIRNEEGRAAMRATGVLLLLLAAAGAGYAGWTGTPSVGCALVVAAPLAIAGLFAALGKGERRLRVALTAGAIFVTVVLALNCAVDAMMRRESVRELMQLAAARGYAATPVFYMLADDRSGQFYAGGRLQYGPDGEPFRFDGAQDLGRAVREKGGTALVLIPTRWEYQLTDYRGLETELLGGNGVLSLAHVRAP
ncbi:MAG TPA: glycosyltransferase family 39 protein [Pyrinomonadaceae bacterium]